MTLVRWFSQKNTWGETRAWQCVQWTVTILAISFVLYGITNSLIDDFETMKAKSLCEQRNNVKCIPNFVPTKEPLDP